jgi:hypothetical protein
MDVLDADARVRAERNGAIRFRAFELVHVCQCGMAGTGVLCGPAASELLHRACARNAIDRSGKAGPDRKQRVKRELSTLEKQAADALRRARRLPVGAARNDLRQLAMGLLWLHGNGMDALMKQRPLSQLPADDAEGVRR